VEIMGKYPHYDINRRDEPLKWRRMLEKSGLSLRSFHPHYSDLYEPENNLWLRNRKCIEQSIEHLAALGGEYLILHAGKLADGGLTIDMRVRRAIRNLEEILRFRQDRRSDIKICIEHEGDNFPGIRNIIEHFNDERIGFCFDSSHATLYPGNNDFLDDFKTKIYSIHLSDNLGSNDDHLPPFQGIVNWKAVIQQLVKNEYRGPWHLEVSPGSDSQGTLKVMKDSMAKLVELLRSTLDESE